MKKDKEPSLNTSGWINMVVTCQPLKIQNSSTMLIASTFGLLIVITQFSWWSLISKYWSNAKKMFVLVICKTTGENEAFLSSHCNFFIFHQNHGEMISLQIIWYHKITTPFAKILPLKILVTQPTNIIYITVKTFLPTSRYITLTVSLSQT